MSYAYFDKANVFHVVPTEDEAKQYSGDGKYVATDIPNEYGYPTMDTAIGPQQVICYRQADGTVIGYDHGNRYSGTQVDVSSLQPVFDQLK